MQSIRLHSVSPTLPMQPSSSCTVGDPAENGQKFAQNDFQYLRRFFAQADFSATLQQFSSLCDPRK